jgi:hypothetical protein
VQTVQRTTALVQAANQTSDDQRFIIQLHTHISDLDDLAARLGTNADSQEKDHAALQTALEQLVQSRQELALRFRDLEGMTASDSCLSAVIQSGDALLSHVQASSAVPTDVTADYLSNSIRCLNAVAELQTQFSQHTAANYSAMKQAASAAGVHLLASACLFFLVLCSLILVLYPAKHMLQPHGELSLDAIGSCNFVSIESRKSMDGNSN